MNSTIPAGKSRADRSGFPVRLVTAVIAVSLLLFVAGVWKAWQLEAGFAALKANQLEISDYVGQARYFDEAMTMSALMAAETGDIAYARRYSDFAARLGALIEKQKRLHPEPGVRQFVERTDEANGELTAIEGRSLALSAEGRSTEATALLTSDEYIRLEGIYADGVEKTAAWNRAVVERDLQRLHVATIVFAIAGGGVIFLLIWIWIYVLRATLRWNHDRWETAASLRRVDDLEQRVRERTAELQAANEVLHQNAESLAREMAESKRIADQLAIASAIAEGSPAVLARWRFPASGTEEPIAEYISPNLVQYGYRPEDILSGRVNFFREIMHPDDRTPVMAGLAEAVAKGLPEIRADFRIVLKDGETRWVEGDMRFEKDAAGKIVFGQGFIRDITERKRSEVAQQMLAAIVRSSHDAIVGKTPAGTITSWNPAAEKMYGYRGDEIIGRNISEIIPADLRRENDDVLARIARGEEIGEFETAWMKKDGTRLAVSISVSPIRDAAEKLVGISSVTRDISERMAMASAVAASEKKFRDLVESVSDWVWEVDDKGRYTYCSPGVKTLLGYDPAELIGKTPFELMAPAEAARIADIFGSRVAEQKPLESVENTVRHKDGHLVTMETSGAPVFDADGAVKGYRGIDRDISERKRAEEALRESSQIIDGILNAIPVRVFWKDRNLVYLGCNEVFARDAGFSKPEQLVGKDDYQMGWRDQAELYRAADRAVIESGRSKLLIEEPQTTPEGKSITLLTSKLPLCNSNGEINGVLGTYMDITERKETIEALAYRDRLLQAVTVGTAALVQAASLDDGMPEALRIVGEAMRVDRVLVLQDCPTDISPVTLRHMWQAPDIQLRLDPAAFAAMPIDPMQVALWRVPLSERRAVNMQLAGSERRQRKLLEAMQNKSVLLVPIFAGGRLWGSFGIDACTVARDWSDGEIAALEIFADAIGALILREEISRALAASEERFRVLSATAQDAIIMIDAEGQILYWNPAAERILGYSAEDALGKHLHELIAPSRFREKFSQGMAAFTVTGDGTVVGKTVEVSALRKDGVEIDAEVSVAGVMHDGKWQAIGIMRDITERKRTEQGIFRMAHIDGLTGLANRSTFVDALQNEIARTRRGENAFAVLYLDLDHFKDINDTLGHPIGDLLLRDVAGRLQACVREIDTVARFGGDEFAIIGADIADAAGAAVLADKILKAVNEPFSIKGNEIRSGASVGIAIHGVDAPDAETLLSHADIALYRAKSEGRGTYRFFTAAMDDEVQQRFTMSTELRAAVESGQLFVLYQPEVEIETRRIVGLEALVRWNHPRRGIIGPGEFIPTAEHTGLIGQIGHWMMQEVCRQIRVWLDAGYEPCVVAVNVSGMQFKGPFDLEKDIAAILAETGLTPNALELELTETVLMEASQKHNDALMRMRKTGLRLAIDDFGTGYSSLDYLRQFPVDRIKIAQNFIMDIGTVPGDLAIVKAAISLALALDIKVIAEGVETEEQLELLRTLGCQEAQGFYFFRPLAPEAIADLLRGDRIVARPSLADTA